MIEETPHHRGTTLVRRLYLEPGEATRWHIDPFHRVSVVLRGEVLMIEFRNRQPEIEVRVSPGQVDWDEPGGLAHRAAATFRTRKSRSSSSPTTTMFRSQTVLDRGLPVSNEFQGWAVDFRQPRTSRFRKARCFRPRCISQTRTLVRHGLHTQVDHLWTECAKHRSTALSCLR